MTGGFPRHCLIRPYELEQDAQADLIMGQQWTPAVKRFKHMVITACDSQT